MINYRVSADYKAVALLRTTERPEYFRHSLKSMYQTIGPDTLPIVVSNTPDPLMAQKNRRVHDDVIAELGEHSLYSEGLFWDERKSLGGPGVINFTVERVAKLFPHIEYFIVLDDDVLLAEQGDHEETWDEALIRMMDCGWGFVGHPCRAKHYEDHEAKREIGDVVGIERTHLCGATSAFRIKDWEKVGGVPEIDNVFGYCPHFQQAVSTMYGGQLPAYFGDHSGFLTQDFDDHNHPLSQRLSEYFGWYEHMRPGKAKLLQEQGLVVEVE